MMYVGLMNMHLILIERKNYFAALQETNLNRLKKRVEISFLNGQDSKRYFTEKDIGRNKQMKRCSISLVVRKIQTKTIMRYHYRLTRMVKNF